MAATVRNEFRDANVTGICANLTVSKEDSQSMQTAQWTGAPFNDNASILDRALISAITPESYQFKFDDKNVLLAADNFFVTKYLEDNSIAAAIAFRQGYAPTTTVSIIGL